MDTPIHALVDFSAEQSILGQMLAFGVYPDYESAGLRREHFHRPAHLLIWDGVQAIHDQGGVADLVTVGRWLREADTLDEVQPSYFSKLIDGVARPGGSNIAQLTTWLQELASGRAVFYAAQKVQGQLREPGAVADGAIAQHLDTVQAILEQHHGRGAAWLNVSGQILARQQEVETKRSGHRVYLGLPAIDEHIGGVCSGEVCGLMGRPGIGKTVILSHIARAVTETFGHVFVSLEMPASQIVGRLRQMLYGWGRYQLEDREEADVVDHDPYRETFKNLVIIDTPGLSIAEIGRRVRQVAQGPLNHVPIRLVTIDHLGLVGGDRGLSTYDRVSVQAREVKELAKRLNCGVLLAIQVNRDAGGDGSRELGLGSARDSGVVEEAMDYLIGIRRLDRSLTLTPYERERYKDVIFAKVVKNRHGDPGATETAYRFSPIGLTLTEDKHLTPESDDIARIAKGSRR